MLCADRGHSQDFIVESGWVRSLCTCVLVCVCVYSMFVCVQHIQTDILVGRNGQFESPTPHLAMPVVQIITLLRITNLLGYI